MTCEQRLGLLASNFDLLRQPGGASVVDRDSKELLFKGGRNLVKAGALPGLGQEEGPPLDG